MDPGALAGELARARKDGLVPMAIVATAGTTDFGAIDPLAELAAAAREHGAWFHVDAAFGGGLMVSGRHGHLLDGSARPIRSRSISTRRSSSRSAPAPYWSATPPRSAT